MGTHTIDALAVVTYHVPDSTPPAQALELLRETLAEGIEYDDQPAPGHDPRILLTCISSRRDPALITGDDDGIPYPDECAVPFASAVLDTLLTNQATSFYEATSELRKFSTEAAHLKWLREEWGRVVQSERVALVALIGLRWPRLTPEQLAEVLDGLERVHGTMDDFLNGGARRPPYLA
ncbi:hypothetical protein ACFWYW_23855 [Nonomuraea sp. NPDC059023]|uniref:hypothetical protein n=1 Tax=unclassified Nonomuraea TaxID=2593643 RepID=UPI0036A2D527